MSHSLQRSFLRAGRSSGVRAALLYTAIVAVLFVLYARQAASFGTDAPLMPVDDAYIHFQYARQAAAGQPFAYNAGQGATSGATSLFYPFVLAVGHALGFDGLRLGWWAYLIGASALLLSAFAARAAARAAGLSRWQHDLLGAAVAAWGALAWHTFSGMETALVVAFALLTFHAFERGRLLPFVVSASLLAMLRPEASIMSVVAVGLFLLRELLPRFRRHRIRRLTRPASLAVLAVPVLAAGLQPLLNLALTNSASASGGQAKSLLSIVPFDAVYVVGRIADNFIRAWEGFVVGVDRSGLWLLPPLSGMVALFGLFLLARRRPFVALLAALWLVLIFGLISTLDTANWHFRRYHMPLLALVWPLVAYAAAGIAARLRVRALLVVSAFVVSALLNVVYLDAHRDNVESVAAQPLAMARWLAVNTPADSLVAVHDVGLMRYLGGRDTLDMVGLTSAGMAEAWRSGPGAVGEALVHAPRRPDYIAAYDDARGLSYLADSLYGELMAAFRHDFDPSTNVALGGPFQGIYRPGWDGADAAATPRVSAIHSYLDGFDLTDTLNVAHLPDERAHDYRWANVSRFDGFATEMYLLDTPGCDAACRVLDGGRQLNGFESFTLAAQPGRDHILVSRFHAPQG